MLSRLFDCLLYTIFGAKSVAVNSLHLGAITALKQPRAAGALQHRISGLNQRADDLPQRPVRLPVDNIDEYIIDTGHLIPEHRELTPLSFSGIRNRSMARRRPVCIRG